MTWLIIPALSPGRSSRTALPTPHGSVRTQVPLTHPCKMPGLPRLRTRPAPAGSVAPSQRPWPPTMHDRTTQASRSRAGGPQAMVRAPASLLAKCGSSRVTMCPLEAAERKQSQPRERPGPGARHRTRNGGEVAGMGQPWEPGETGSPDLGAGKGPGQPSWKRCDASDGVSRAGQRSWGRRRTAKRGWGCVEEGGKEGGPGRARCCRSGYSCVGTAFTRSRARESP